MKVQSNRLVPVYSTARGARLASALLMLFAAACSKDADAVKEEEESPDFNSAPAEAKDPFAGSCAQIFTSPDLQGRLVTTDTRTLLTWVQAGEIDPDKEGAYLPQAATEAVVTCAALKMRLPTVAEGISENKNCEGIMGARLWTQALVLEGEPLAAVRMFVIASGLAEDADVEVKLVARCVRMVGAADPAPLPIVEPDAGSTEVDAGATDPDATASDADAGSVDTDATDPPDAATVDTAP